MTDTDAFYTTGCGNCACSSAALRRAGGCPMALHSQLRNESPKPVLDPVRLGFIKRYMPCAGMVLWFVVGVLLGKIMLLWSAT